MRIGLNLLYLIPGVVGGTETHAAGLLGGLAAQDERNEYLVFVNQESRDWPLPDSPNFKRVVCPVTGRRQASRYFFEQLLLPGLAKKHRVDVLHSLGYVGPLLPGCPSIVTVHDLNYRAFGREMPFPRRVALRAFVRGAVHCADRIFTVSEFSRREIAEAFGVSPTKFVITPNAPPIPVRPHISQDVLASIRERHGVQSPYIVAFSSSTPNKNIPRLIQAFEHARSKYDLVHQLVLVGHYPRKVSSSRDQLFSSNAIRLTGYLPEAELMGILGGAELLVFPSIYEGFGLPILEAMSLGVPVVCSTTASLPEVAGNAAEYFDPYSSDEIARQMVRVALDERLRRDLVRKGFQNVDRFSWHRTAQTALKTYGELLRR